MDLETVDYRIKFQESYYSLLINDDVLKTPKGHVIKHNNRILIEHILFELECVDKLDVTELSTYSLLSTQIDLIEDSSFKLTKDAFRKIILNDPTLKACAGPEKLYQFTKWRGLFENLEILNIDYPDIIQAAEISDVEDWICSMGQDYVNSIDKFVSHFYRELEVLSFPQKTVVINSIQLHGSVIYGILLATKKCNEMDYSAAILASHCMIPNVFADVKKTEYREAFIGLKQDATILSNFINLSLTPDIDLAGLIKTNLTNWGFLPEGSRIALTESINKIHLANSDDYSPYVMLLGKSIEISLKILVFDEFLSKSGYIIEEQKDISVFLKENLKIFHLAKFLVKEPHFIELGSMLVILEKDGGKTANNNILLKAFFEFIDDKLHFTDILNPTWINKVKIISAYRNKAAHSERFTLDKAREIQTMTFEILHAF